MSVSQTWLGQGLCPAELLHRRMSPVDEYEVLFSAKGDEGVVVRWVAFHNPNYADSVVSLALSNGFTDNPPDVDHLMLDITVPAKSYVTWQPPMPVLIRKGMNFLCTASAAKIITSVWGNTP